MPIALSALCKCIVIGPPLGPSGVETGETQSHRGRTPSRDKVTSFVFASHNNKYSDVT